MIRQIKTRIFRWLLHDLAGDSNYLSHCRRELSEWFAEEGPNRWIAEGTEDLLCVLAMQGHSGGSIGYAVETFKAMAFFQPISPLTGDSTEWNDAGDGVLQNRRLSRVFKDKETGEAYDIEGRIFRGPGDGNTYTNFESRVPVTFPYVPSRVYVDVDDDGNVIQHAT